MDDPNTMRKICILCAQHLPDDRRVTHRLGRSFRKAGYAVTWVGPERRRTGDDYGIRFVYYPAATSRIGRLTHGARLLRAASSLGPQDVYFAVEPDSAAVALKLARRNRGRAVFDIHEIYHKEMLTRWIPGPFRSVLGFAVKRYISNICSRCDLVVGVGKSRLDPYTNAKTPRMLVRHCVPLDFAPSPGPGPFHREGNPLTVLHGKVTMNRGTSEMLHALAVLKHEYSIPCRVIMFQGRADIATYKQTDVDRLAKELGVAEEVSLRPEISYREMFPLMHSCDVGVIAYRRQFGQQCMPNRIFEYMAAGVPVIAPSYADEVIGIIQQYQCGLLCNTEDPGDLARTLRGLWEDKGSARRMGANGRAAFERELSWEKESQPLLDWINAQPG